MVKVFSGVVLAAALMLAGAAAFGQANIALGTLNADPTLPVEVSADTLSVNQASGAATFTGNVVIGQGDLRIAAGEVSVIYDAASGKIVRLRASGGVTFTTATEAAEAQSADYDLTAQTLLMEGDVLLTQGQNAISADRMTIDLATGSAQMDGRVRTVLAPEAN